MNDTQPERRRDYTETKEDLHEQLVFHASDLQHQLKKHTDHIENRLSGFFFKALLAFAVIGITSTIALGGFGVLLSRMSSTDEQLASQAVAIQKQRRLSISETCKDQNKRHDMTVGALFTLSAKTLEKEPNIAVQDKIRKSRNATVLLIDALVPKRDCKELVQKSVQPVLLKEKR